MKKMLLALLSLLQLNVFAQITLDAGTFPSAGDTLRFAIDDTPDGINPATPPGGSIFWDFSSLNVVNTTEVVYRSANQGMNAAAFPGADLVVINQGGETYFNKTTSRFENLGYAGEDPAGVSLDVTARFQPALVERRNPTSFFDINNSIAALSLVFPTDQPPLDSIFGSLPVNIDSMRVRITTNRLDVVDAWGNCAIPGATYPVLRQKRTEYRETALDVYVLLFPGFGNWVDLSTLIGGGGGGGLGNFIGTDTLVSYRFLSNTEKEEIAVATMSNDLSTVETVRFKDLTTTPSFEPAGFAAAAIQAYPNPAVEWVRFDCTNLPQDEYTIKIYNIIGKVIWKENYSMAGNKSVRLELEDFKKGTYLYSLVDSKGNTLSTKRLVILKP